MPAPPADKAMSGGSADRMGNMNPERLQRLRRSPSNEELVYQRMDGSPLPRKSGAAPAPIPVSAAVSAHVSAAAQTPALAAKSGSRVKPVHPPDGKGQKKIGTAQTGAARPKIAGPRPPAGNGNDAGRAPAAGADAGAGSSASARAGPAQPAAARAQQLPVVLKQERVVLPPISVMTGIQRPSSHVAEDDDEKGKAVATNGLRCRPIVQHGGAQPYEINADTRYLEGMLGYHRFRLTVQPWAGKVGSMSYSRIVTHAGLLLHGFLRASTSIPVLPLPAVTSTTAAGEPSVAGPLDQTIRGQVLEEVWSSLTPTVKFSLARQLRRIVTSMRAAGADLPPAERMLGSARSGAWSIIMDRHRTKTYWAIQEAPTHWSFVGFLQATFDASVPRTISNALFRQLHADGAEYATVLAHGEIAPRSIVIDGNRIVAVLGWNCSGWYPEWWDYAKFFETGTRAANRDWYDYASEIFDKEYPAELAAYQGFVRCQKP